MPTIPGVIELSSLNGSNGFAMSGANASDVTGYSLSSAGDVNGDGFDDLLISAVSANAGAPASGAAYVVFGKSSGFSATINLGALDGSSGFRIAGVAANDRVGFAVGSAGDVNGDGFDDLLVATPTTAPNGAYSGETFVVFGGDGPFSATLNLSSLNGTNGFKINGEAAADYSGRAVSSAGDVNGDGFDDILIGAYRADAGSTDSGAVYVVFGTNSGFSASLSLGSLNGTNGFQINGEAANDLAGRSVSSAGDVNGDDIDDILIGAGFADAGAADSGAAYVVFGTNSGFAANLNLSSLNGTNGFQINGVAADDYAGVSVSSAGDVNGDGVDDLLVGASRVNANGADNTGAAYLVFGTSAGFNSTLDLSGLDGSNGYRISGVAAGDYAGVSVSGAGDVNGDGYDDLLIGAWNVDSNGASAVGATYVVFGGTNGFNGNLNLQAVNGANGFTVNGVSGFDYAGKSVSGAGDVNGDGLNDILIGAWGSNVSGDNSGAAYVVFGVDRPTVNISMSDSYLIAGEVATVTFAFSKAVQGFTLDDVTAPQSAMSNLVTSDGGKTWTANYQPFSETVNPTNVISVDLAGLSHAVSGTVGEGTASSDNFTVDTRRPTATVTLADSSITNREPVQVTIVFSMPVTGFTLDDISAPNGVLTNLRSSDAGTTWTATFAPNKYVNDIDNFISVNTAGVVVTSGSSGLGAKQSENFTINTMTQPSFGAVFNLNSLNGLNGFQISGAALADLAGSAVSSAGDVNGDGYDDVIVSAPSADPLDRSGAGTSYVIYGQGGAFDANINLDNLGLNSFSTARGFRIVGEGANNASGSSIASAGDVNNDGFDDVIVGAVTVNGNKGAAYVVFGTNVGFGASIDLADLTGTNGFQINGDAVGDNLGRSVASAGDVNHDGIDDIIVGAWRNDAPLQDSGAAYVIFGKQTGFTAEVNVTSLDGTNGFKIEGEQTNGTVGLSVSTAGDINGDGIADLLVASRNVDDGTTINSGATYVVFGKDDGFNATLSLSALDGTNGFQITGTGANDFSGVSAATAGDFNGDGFDDLIIGASGADLAGQDSGAAYVVFGSDDGFSAEMNLSTLDGSNGFRLPGLTLSEYAGSSVASAGDVNGDGLDDLIIGAYYADSNGPDAGSAYIVFGTRAPMPASFDLSTLNGTNGFRINGEVPNDQFGNSVRSAGDINQDGADDLIVGAYFADPNDSASGAAYVIYGINSGPTLTITMSDDSLTVGETSIVTFAFSEAVDSFTTAQIVAPNGRLSGLVSIDGNVTFTATFTPKAGTGDGTNVISVDLTQIKDELDNPGTGTASGPNYAVLTNGGNDAINGDGTDELLNAGAGNDRVFGNGGNDTLIGGTGNDILNGGVGTDTANYEDAGAGVTVSLAVTKAQNTGGAGTDVLTLIENLTGSAFNDRLTGNAGANLIDGAGSDDRLDGGTGNDTLIGGLGNDTLIGGLGIDVASYRPATADLTISLALATQTITGFGTDSMSGIEGLEGGSGNDSLTGNALANLLIGNAGDDTLMGAEGNDVLIGGAGSDQMNGGVGNDVFIVNSAIDHAASETIAGDAGVDELRFASTSAATLVLNATVSVERIVVGTGTATAAITTGTAAINVDASALSEAVVMIGNNGANRLTGGAGADNLSGGLGNDTLVGGGGNDTLAGGLGIDVASYSSATADLAVTLVANGSVAVTGFGTDRFSAIEGLEGGAGHDSLTGDAAANVLLGGAGNDTLVGGLGHDTLSGGLGDDSIVGGAGNDVASYATATSEVEVNLLLSVASVGTLGADTLVGIEGVEGGSGDDVLVGATSSAILLGNGGDDYLEGNLGNDSLNGGSGNDYLIGGAGNDTLIGGDGVDDVYYGNATKAVRVNLAVTKAQVTGGEGTDVLIGIENLHGSSYADVLTGSALNNEIEAGQGNDTLIGGAGADRLSGSSGNDLFILSAISDFAMGEEIDGGDDTDEVRVSATIAGTLTLTNLVEDVERVVIGTGAGLAAVTTGTAAINIDASAVGNALTIIGNAGANRLTGTAANDSIDGGAGNDTMIGGLGNDTLVGGAGVDIVSYASATVSLTIDLGLSLQSAGAFGADSLVGIEGVEGGSDGDSLYGGASNDILFGGAGHDLLRGNAGNDLLNGGDGNDTVSGGLGNDTLNGGAGEDLADYSHATARVNVNLSTTAAQNTGSAGTDLLIGIENIEGSSFGDLLTGSTLANRIDGGFGSGNDTIIGGGGADVMFGRDGDDLFVLNSFADFAIGEQIIGDNGTDELRFAGTVAGTLTLSSGITTVERVVIGTGIAAAAVTTGIAAINLDANAVTSALQITGNSGANTITGTSLDDTIYGGLGNDTLIGEDGADSLHGGAGNDSLTGGVGADDFVFRDAFSASNVDRITDFTAVDDDIHLLRSVVTGIASTGTLAANAFIASAGLVAATDANQRIVYNTTTGDLYYDVDGLGGKAAVRFATLNNLAALTHEDFMIF